MKAWRLEADKINARRNGGSKEPNARVQKVQRQASPKVKGAGNWLLAVLLVRAGVAPYNQFRTKKEENKSKADELRYWSKLLTFLRKPGAKPSQLSPAG